MNKQSNVMNHRPVPMRRKLRKYEYTVNTPQYLESMDKVMLLINKEFRSQIDSFYIKVQIEGIKGGLDEIGIAYLIKRLEDNDFPNLKEWNSKTLSLFIRAKHFDNSLTLKDSTTYLKTLKGYDMKEIIKTYKVSTDKIIKKLSVLVYVSYMKITRKFMMLSKAHCMPMVFDKRSCLYFKQDIQKALNDNDFRVSHHKVNNLLPMFLLYL